MAAAGLHFVLPHLHGGSLRQGQLESQDSRCFLALLYRPTLLGAKLRWACKLFPWRAWTFSPACLPQC